MPPLSGGLNRLPDLADEHGLLLIEDATQGTSSMTVIGDDPRRRSPNARAAEARWLSGPCHRGMHERDLARLATAIRSIR